MRFAQIRSMDISNGEGVGVSLFVQGCDKSPHCKNCFNSETWDFNGGKEWTEETKEQFINWSADMDIRYDRVFSIIDIKESNIQKWGDSLPFYRNVKKEGIVLWKAA